MSAAPKEMSKPLYQPAAVVGAVRLLVGDGNVTELRALVATTATDRWPHTASGYFDHPEKLAAALATIKAAQGIYIVPNPIKRPVSGPRCRVAQDTRRSIGQRESTLPQP